LRKIPFLKLQDQIQTNIIFAEVIDEKWNAGLLSDKLKEKGICISVWTPKLIRLVVHRDIYDEHIIQTIQAFQELEGL
jgi:threonine aldolase